MSADFYDFNCMENNILKHSLIINNSPLVILCVYRSPSTDYTKFVNSLRKIFDSLNLFFGLIVLIDDININIICPQLDKNEYLDLLSTFGFASFINLFTRLPNGQQHSCLDHIFIKGNNTQTFNEINAGVFLTDITDHCSAVMLIPLFDNLKVCIKLLMQERED